MRISDWSSDVCSSDLEEDDHLAEHGRFDHLLRSTHRFFEPLPKRQQPSFVFLTMRQSRQADLDDDHGAIDDQTKVHCAKAHQIAQIGKHTSELQPPTRISFAVLSLKQNNTTYNR